MKKKIFLIATVLLVLMGTCIGSAYLFSHKSGKENIEATASGMHFEIADTPAKQELGLGNRASIPDNYGMLFVFQKPDRYGFWMKDMLVPIDITWLSDKGDVILIDHSVDPSTYPHAFYPPVSVKYVLETRAGYAADHKWEVGTHVPLPSPYGS